MRGQDNVSPSPMALPASVRVDTLASTLRNEGLRSVSLVDSQYTLVNSLDDHACVSVQLDCCSARLGAIQQGFREIGVRDYGADAE
jgi:hypothetical protein